MSTDIVAAIYNNVAQLFIGKVYSPNALGYFNQAQKIKDLPIQSAVLSVQTVTYPALSKIKDDSTKFADSYRKVLMINAFVMMPVAIGMSVVAGPLFNVLLGEKWLKTIPYFEVLALSGIFYPLAMAAYNVLKVHSNGAIIFRLELLKKTIMTLVLALTIPSGIYDVACGLVLMTLVEFLVNFAATRYYTYLDWYKMVRAIAPSLILAVVMGVSVELFEQYILSICNISQFLLLLSQVSIGVLIYILGGWIFRLEAFKEFLNVVKVILKR
jgi:O-antigen/teichoic acid export membrane protein